MKRKRLAGLMLSVVMAVSAVGCGSTDTTTTDSTGSTTTTDAAAESSTSTTGEIIEINCMFPTPYELSGVDEVEDAINQITEEKYGIHLNLNFVSFSNYTTQLNLQLTGDEVDIFKCFTYKDYVKNGQLADLTEYWENASDAMKETIPEERVQAHEIDGKIYGLAYYTEYAHAAGLNIDEEIAAEYGIEDGQSLTLEDVDTFLAWCKENYPDRYPLAPQGTRIFPSFWIYDSMEDSIGVLGNYGQETTLDSLFDNAEFLEACEYASKWYEAGYVTADILSNSENWLTTITNKKAISVLDTYSVSSVDGMIRTVIMDGWTYSGAYSGDAFSINVNSRNKDAAWTALEILYTDEEVGYYLYNGIEGRDYVKNDDGTISYPDGLTAADVPYGMSNCWWWIGPNAALGYPLQSNGATFFEDLDAFCKQGIVSKASGFIFDVDPVLDEYTACINVLDKYEDTLMAGAAGDLDSILEQAREEMKAAGEDAVIAEKQRQLDEFFENQDN